MSKRTFVAVLVSAMLVALLGTGCGGSKAAVNSVVAQVGHVAITEANLNHWAATFVRGDFYQSIGQKAPAGLATDPPDYAACIRAGKALAPSPATGKPVLTRAQLDHRCHALYAEVREEALSYLISVLWAVGQAAELGKRVSDQDVQRYLGELVKHQYKTQQAFVTYLANKGWSRADMQYILKRNLLVQQLTVDAQRKAQSLGGGQRGLVKAILGRNAKWTVATSCRAGYVVWQCKEYHPTTASSELSPAVIFEEMRGGRIVKAASH